MARKFKPIPKTKMFGKNGYKFILSVPNDQNIIKTMTDRMKKKGYRYFRKVRHPNNPTRFIIYGRKGDLRK